MQKVIEKSENPQAYYKVRRLCRTPKGVFYWESYDRTFSNVKEAETFICTEASVVLRNKTLRFCIDEVRMVEFVEFV